MARRRTFRRPRIAVFDIPARATKSPIFRKTGRRVRNWLTGLRTGRAAAPATIRPDRPSLTPGSRRLRECTGRDDDATFFGGRGMGALTRPARRDKAASARQKYARTRPHGPKFRVFGTSSSGGTASSSSSSSTGADTWWRDRLASKTGLLQVAGSSTRGALIAGLSFGRAAVGMELLQPRGVGLLPRLLDRRRVPLSRYAAAIAGRVHCEAANVPSAAATFVRPPSVVVAAHLRAAGHFRSVA